MQSVLAVLCVIAGCDWSWNHDHVMRDAGDGGDVDSLSDADPSPDASTAGVTTLTVEPSRVRSNGIARATLTLTLRDGAGQPIANRTVTVVPDGTVTITAAATTTDASGMYVARLSSTTAGTREVIVIAAPDMFTASVTFTDACDEPRFPAAPAPAINSAISGDFNGDGRLDLVGSMSDGLGYASGNGDGTFNAPELTTVSVGYGTLAPGDFDGDGDVDLAAVGNGMVGQQVTFLRNDGDAVFAPATPIQTSGNAQVATAADFDGDGKLDVAYASGSDQGAQVTVLFGNGNGTFSAPTYIWNAASATGAVLLAVDIDGDNDADLVSGEYYHTALRVNLSNGGARTFDNAQQVPLGGTAGIGGISAGHLNANTALDVIVGRYVPNGVTVVLDAFTASPQVTNLSIGTVRDSVLIVDVNADNKRDLVASDSSGLYVALGNGAGGLASPAFTSGAPLSSLVAGDFTGDGKLDLAATSGNTTLELTGDGLGGFLLPAIGLGGQRAVAVADFTGDGKPDIAAVPLDPWGTNQQIQIHRNLGGTFAPPVGVSVGSGLDTIVTADFDGDGDNDLAVSTSGDVTTLTNNGAGTFTVGTHVLQSSGNAWLRGLTTDDFNGDGKRDLAISTQTWGDSTATLGIVLGNGSGGFAAPVTSELPGDVWWMRPGDLDGDGNVDLVLHGQINPMWMPGTGTGSFAAAQTIHSDGGLLTGGIAVEDMNGDSKLDVVAASFDVKVFANNGNGTFAPPQTIASWQAGNPVAVADVDADGNLDVIVWGHGLGVLLGRGNGTYDATAYYPSANTDSYHPTFAVDVDADGLLDLVGPGGVLRQSACTP